MLLDRFGLFRDETNVAELSELGVLFLLFEQGLELSFDRLKALAKYAFGLGLVQVLLSTAVFTAFELPVGNAIGTQILTKFLGAAPELVNIRSLDEAIVIGAGLSLSSSAFVLQVLSERGELATPFGRATLGVLLMQDIAVVPLLVVLPLYEASITSSVSGEDVSILATLGPTALKAIVGLGALLVGGRVVLRRVFEVVAGARSTEAFVALCLLTVTGTSLLTQRLGFSDTLGAFLAGVLLAETNYRSQVEADIRPFRGLLLGLFFVTTGTSIDTDLLVREWPNVLGLVVGLIAIKTSIVTAAGPLVGLSRAESVRTGLLVGQGGEFAFVVFSLANQLGVLPNELNKLLIIVVVASMALTPVLAEAGAVAYGLVDRWERGEGAGAALPALGGGSKGGGGEGDEEGGGGELVVCGFGPQGQTVANLLRARQEACGGPGAIESAATGGDSGEGAGCERAGYVAFDLDPRRVQAARRRGYNVLYGDASRPAVLSAAGIKRPAAVAVAYARPERALAAVTSLREAFGTDLPILARARDPTHGAELRAAGADVVIVDSLETGLLLGTALLQTVGEGPARAAALSAAVRGALDAAAGKQLGSLAAPQRDSLPSAPELEAYAAAAAVAEPLPGGRGDKTAMREVDGATSCLLPEVEAKVKA